MQKAQKRTGHRRRADFPKGNPRGVHRSDAGVTTIDISLRDQLLFLKRGEETLRTYPISSSRFGIGTEEGSFKTPTGQFRIGKKIGGGAPTGTIFLSRVPLGPGDPAPPTEDLVMSRILWLDGLEDHNANTRDRYIYIHGTKHENDIGRPASHGCIRMRNADVVELFDLVDEGTPVVIEK
jgi:L,D-transpeptidase YbiS